MFCAIISTFRVLTWFYFVPTVLYLHVLLNIWSIRYHHIWNSQSTFVCRKSIITWKRQTGFWAPTFAITIAIRERNCLNNTFPTTSTELCQSIAAFSLSTDYETNKLVITKHLSVTLVFFFFSFRRHIVGIAFFKSVSKLISLFVCYS